MRNKRRNKRRKATKKANGPKDSSNMKLQGVLPEHQGDGLARELELTRARKALASIPVHKVQLPSPSGPEVHVQEVATPKRRSGRNGGNACLDAAIRKAVISKVGGVSDYHIEAAGTALFKLSDHHHDASGQYACRMTIVRVLAAPDSRFRKGTRDLLARFVGMQGEAATVADLKQALKDKDEVIQGLTDAIQHSVVDANFQLLRKAATPSTPPLEKTPALSEHKVPSSAPSAYPARVYHADGYNVQDALDRLMKAVAGVGPSTPSDEYAIKMRDVWVELYDFMRDEGLDVRKGSAIQSAREGRNIGKKEWLEENDKEGFALACAVKKWG